jgi:hypothetical protein
MHQHASRGRRARGQILALFALGSTVVILATALVIDGGNALVERRASQNASDFAALAGARIVATWISGDAVNGTDANVRAAITSTLAANGADPVTFGPDPDGAGPLPGGPRYVSEAGATTGYVGTGAIPANTIGVTVGSTTTFRPYMLGIIGVNQWKASSEATARGGFAAGPPGGTIFPVGIAEAFFETYPFCTGAVGSGPDCVPQNLTPGNLNIPGGFGWLKFGADRHCSGFGLGMDPNAGCDDNKPFLQEEIGNNGPGGNEPPGNSFGCCTAVSGDPNLDRIGSLPGNKASADCDYYIDNEIVVTVPIWDYAGGTGANGWYHIIGFAGFQITECEGGKNISGVWRKQFSLGPVTATSPGTFASLAVQLVK